MKDGILETTWDGYPVEVEYTYVAGDDVCKPEVSITCVWHGGVNRVRWEGGCEISDQWKKEIIAAEGAAA